MSRFFRDMWLGLVIAFRDVWRGWVSVYVATLRAITGRRRPDYARIAELELSCELAGPPPGRASASIQTPNEVQLLVPPVVVPGHPLIRAAPATREPDDRPARSPRRHTSAWERDYEAGQAKTQAWLDSLPPV